MSRLSASVCTLSALATVAGGLTAGALLMGHHSVAATMARAPALGPALEQAAWLASAAAQGLDRSQRKVRIVYPVPPATR